MFLDLLVILIKCDPSSAKLCELNAVELLIFNLQYSDLNWCLLDEWFLLLLDLLVVFFILVASELSKHWKSELDFVLVVAFDKFYILEVNVQKAKNRFLNIIRIV